MWATDTLRRRLDSSLGFVHKQRRELLWRVVGALVTGRMLWSAALGRFLPGDALQKHRIKAVDRFLGNGALYRQRLDIYAAVASRLLGSISRPVVLVDITELRPGLCALTASVAMSGRSVPLYGQVRRKSTISKQDSIKRFLCALSQVLPEHCVPIVVTDAGFESPWFERIVHMGWDYVGRVRHQTRFLLDGRWLTAQELHRRATRRARNLGQVPFPRYRPKPRRVVLSKARQSKGRTRKNTLGRKGRTATDRKCEQRAREPWLLSTSLTCRPSAIVELYATRMQIEQNYRDFKNHRWGWHLGLSRSRTNARMEMLLLVAALASLLVLGIGCAAEQARLHLALQANTVRNRRVLSLFTLGQLVIDDVQRGARPPPVHDVFSQLRRAIQHLHLLVPD